MDNTIDPELEVRKLQDLVKKLEKQNEILRTKADAIGNQNGNGTLPLTESNTNLNSNGEIKSSKLVDARSKNSNKGLLDSVKVLDTRDEESDDDTWLYQSPIKIASPDQKSVSPMDWVRQDFEHPTRDQESAKKCLLAKLDEVSRANRNSMGPTLMTLQQPQLPTQGNADPLRGLENLDLSPLSQSPPQSQPQRRERRRNNDEKMGGMSKLEDVTDVQILARMQEESLRQAMQSSPANSPRRISVSPASSENALHKPASRSSSMSSTEDGDEGQRSNVVRRRPSFERIRKAGEGNDRKDISPRGAPDGRNGEAKPSAVNRLRGTEEKAKVKNGLYRRHSEARNGERRMLPKAVVRRSPSLDNPHRSLQRAEKSRGSMPNLKNTNNYANQPPAPHPTPCTPPVTPVNSESPPHHLDGGAPDPSSRLRQPNSIPNNRSPSPRTLKQPSPTKLRGASPHRSSGIPVRASQMERSGIPRPKSAIIPKSGIPGPTSKGSAVSPRGSVKTRDDSWREGCY